MKNNIIDLKRTPVTPLPEVVTLAEAKAQCIVTYSDDDTLISRFIEMAIRHIENHCNVSIYPYTIVLTADLVTEYELPYGPVVSLNSVQTRNGNEGSGPASYATQTSGWSTDGLDFLVFAPAGSGFNLGVPFVGYFQWGPYASPYAQSPQNRYRLTYGTGYGTDIPKDLKQAVLLQIAWLYEHRGEEDASRYDWNPGVCRAALVFADPYKRQAWL